MVPASTELTLATANASSSDDVPCKSGTATFSHRNVRFTMDFPSKNIKCSGENHLITSIVQCLGDGHLFCRDCQFTSSPAVLPKEARCPLDGSVIVNDNAQTLSLSLKNIPCPSAITFESGHKAACTWQGPYQDVNSHLDECPGIPDKTKLMMQDQWIKELQAQLTKSEEIQNTVIQFVAREVEALDQRLSEKMDELLVATCSAGDTFKAINARFETIDKIKAGADRLEACTVNIEQRFSGASSRSIRQLAADNLAAERRYLTKLESAAVQAIQIGTLSPVGSPDNTGKCVDVFLWQINEVRPWLTDAVSEESPSLYSPPAYTTEGYCVSGQVRPYKHRSGTSYLGVYIAVWKGQYDEQISWPMRKMIRLSVINQYNPSENVGFTFPSDDKPGFQRPATLINSSRGSPKFFMLKHLNGSEFVKNDTLHIEIKLEDPAPGSFGVAEKH